LFCLFVEMKILDDITWGWLCVFCIYMKLGVVGVYGGIIQLKVLICMALCPFES